MIFCERLLYLHVPKTAGMSVTDVLLRACPRPTYYTHPDAGPRIDMDGVHEIDGPRHETLGEAAGIVREHGFTLDGFDVILAMIRNPYDIEVSRFGYYQKGHPWDAEHQGRDFAMAGDFRSFALHTTPHGGARRSVERFFLLDGVQPPNLRVARYEHLADDLCAVLAEVGITLDGIDLPHHNDSTRGPWLGYYDPETEAAVYQRYRWVFDAGYYPRLPLAAET